MNYNFDEEIERRGSQSVKWDLFSKEALPMWVADMNFATAPSIVQAIKDRADHPAFGYFAPSAAYYESIIDWHRDRNMVTGMKAEHIGYENGVLGCVCSAIQAFTAPGEKILLHSPTYIGFTHCLEDTGRRAESHPPWPPPHRQFQPPGFPQRWRR